MSRITDIPIGGLMAGHVVTFRITGLRRFRFRVWLAIRLVRLAALVMPLDFRIEDER